MADTVINPALQQEQEAAAVLSESILPGMPAGTGAAKPTSPRRLEHGGMQQGPAQMHDSQGMNVGAVPPLPPAPMYTLPPLPVPHPGVADRGLSEMGNGSVPDGGAAAGGGGGGSAAMLSHGSHDGESLHHDYIQQHIVAGHPTTSASSSNVAKPGLYPPPPVPYYQSQYYAAFQQPPHPHYPQQMHMGGESRILDYADVAPLSRVLKRPQPVKFASSSSSNGNDDYVDNIPVMLGKHPREDDEDDLDTPDEVYQMDGPMGGHDSMMQDDSYEPMDENSGRDSPAAASTSKGKGAKGKSAKEKKGVQRPKLKGTACTACRKSKLKCDEGQPCAPCSRRRVDCVRDPGLRLQAWYGELQAAGQAGKFIDGIYAGHFGPSSALHSLGLFAAQQHREQQQQQAAQQAGQDGHAHSPVYLHQQNQSSDLPQQHQHQMSSSRTEGVGEPSNYSNDSSKPALQANHPSEAVQESRAQARAAFQQKVAERASRNGTTSTSTPTHGRNTRASAVKAEGENDGASGLPADADDSASVRPSPHRSTSDSLSGILNERNEDGVSFPSYLEPYRDILLEAGIDSLETLRADLQLEMLKDYVVFLFETYPEKLYNQTQKFKLQYALQKALS